MESSSVTGWCLVWASLIMMIAEVFGASSTNQSVHDSRTIAAIAPALLIALAFAIMAVAALSIRSLRRNQPAEISISLDSARSATTTVDVDALGSSSLALDLDDDSVLDFEEEEEEEDDEAKTRRLGNLLQVMKSGRFFRASGMEELPYSPGRQGRRIASSSAEAR